VFRLFIDQDWAVLQAVGLTSTLHFPDFSVVAVKALVSVLSAGEAVLPCQTAMEEFISLCILLGLQFTTEQVNDCTV
jgi:hypothetical protein